jgi:hypothetical protein
MAPQSLAPAPRAVLLAALAFAPATLLAAAPARATDMVALEDGLRLVRFTDGQPGVISWRSIKGASGKIVGIDVRPADGKLYALAADGGVYLLDPATGMATMKSKLNVAPTPDATVVDFNPVADRLRVVTSAGRSLRVNVETGETVEDGKLNYAAGDANAGKMPGVTGGGYSNSGVGPKPAATGLYQIDSGAKAIALQDPPNAGTLQSKAMVKMPAQALRGGDVWTGADGKLTQFAVSGARLYRIDVASGAIALVGNIGPGDRNLIDVAVLPAMK